MYRVRYLEQNDKMSGQVRLSMFEQVYERALLQQCAQQSVSSAQKARRGRQLTARAVFLTDCGSHATIGLHIGRYEEAELHGAYALLPQVSRGMLLMHDANFFGGAYLEALNAKGVRALFALPSTVGVQRRRNLPDGSYLALLKPNAQAVYPMQQPVWVRVIEYQLTDERLGEPGQVYRLATTWLNPHTAPAKEPIVLYHQRRWV